MTKRYFPWILLIALLLGFFVRAYRYREMFMYGHDNDLASWIIKDIVVDKHPRLIGQLTSSPGIFIGSLYYYTIIPFYLLAHMDPIGSVAFSWIIGLLSIVSVYYTFRKLYGSSYGEIGSLVYAVSWGIAVNEREVVPTTPVMLWSIWFFFAINLLFQGQKRGLWIMAVLFALVWHLNLALILLIPLVVLAVLINRSRFSLRQVLGSLSLLIVLSLPLILFEVRHNFNQTRALFSTLISTGSQSGYLSDKVLHVIQYAAKNATGILVWNAHFSLYIIPAVLLGVIITATLYRKLPRYYLPMLLLWFFFYIFFFAMIRLNLSEYYLNGLNIVWIFAATVLISFLVNSRIPLIKLLGGSLLGFLIFYNIRTFLSVPLNRSGYVYRKMLVEYIAADAARHHYPCISVSYITDPGYNLGYRYFFWLNNLHVNQPMSLSPVYTIVFPLSRVDRLDKTFGALGLIYPDYQRYTPEQIAVSCSGQNANLTDPMFGFTK
jgi:hypothetical protein